MRQRSLPRQVPPEVAVLFRVEAVSSMRDDPGRAALPIVGIGFLLAILLIGGIQLLINVF